MRENRPLQRYIRWFGFTLSLVMVFSAGLAFLAVAPPPSFSQEQQFQENRVDRRQEKPRPGRA